VDEEDNDKMITAMEMGVADYLIRPVDRHELTVRVKSQIRQKLYADSLRDNMKKNMEMAVTDSVTGLYNRHFLDNHLGNLLSPNNEDRDAVGIIMMDLDFFKKVNDTYGHAAGDEVLAEFARRVTRNIRSIDLAVRYGGEEFIVVVPESDAEFTITVAERIRKAIEAKPFEVSTHTETIPVTVSIGVSLSEDKYMDGGALMIAADKALYEAKETGRNKVCGLAS
jgi:two-component system cell cycle response regulator